ncbi:MULTISPECIES: helix-turn-helix domain-containing protein [Bacillaceae]|uniref:Helix-turn-helix domain-containing protein n=1 Tax=Evansella alkalicola TaxID=745819 RepID=A0ABS6JS05_9BACI|nr:MULTISPECIES: helix-turn-helix domain-containing protein [Bacillaceae]MBU9721348.1 helix-turn-helix domain-containing protein [Bacillus alkalicola]
MRRLIDYPEVLTVRDVEKILGISRVKAYELVHSQNFRIVRIGARILISKKSFEQWFEGITNK